MFRETGTGPHVSQRLWKNSPERYKGIVFCEKIRSRVSPASPSAVSMHLWLYRRKPLTFNLSIVNCQLSIHVSQIFGTRVGQGVFSFNSLDFTLVLCSNPPDGKPSHTLFFNQPPGVAAPSTGAFSCPRRPPPPIKFAGSQKNKGRAFVIYQFIIVENNFMSHR